MVNLRGLSTRMVAHGVNTVAFGTWLLSTWFLRDMHFVHTCMVPRHALLDGPGGDQEPELRESGGHLVHGNPQPWDAGRK